MISYQKVVKKEKLKIKRAFPKAGEFQKLTEANIGNGYLEQLVLTYLHQNNPLGILERATQQEKSSIFLEHIGWGQKKDYIDDTLNAYLSDKLQPVVYVFTPNDSFKYKVTAQRVDNEGIRSRDGDSTFHDAVNDIMRHVDVNLRSGKESLIHILFYNSTSRDKFEGALKKKLDKLKEKDLQDKEFSYAVKLQKLDIPNYGTVNLHNYTIRVVRQPDK